MQRVNIGLVCLSWLVLASAVSAQTAVDPSSDAGIASIQNFNGGGVLSGTYFDIRHLTGDGVGYRNSYSQIGAFTPVWVNEDAFIAPNARLIITNSTQVGVNAGLVGRKYVDSLDRIFGVYGYYDNDQDSLNYRYSQFTVGSESIGKWWELRGNGYFLNGMNDNLVSPLCVGGNPYFTGNQISFLGTQLRDQSMGGGDVEFGVPVSANAQWLRAFSGVYAYRTSQQDTFGYRGRIEAMVSNDLTLGVIVSQDRLWGTNINATIDFKFSGFQPTRYFPNLTTRERMLQPVQRNWRIATHTYVQNVDVAAINPETNAPYFVTHIDKNAAAGGTGTIQRPFNYLPNSAPGDIILVHGGNTAANPIMGSLALSDHQRLLGDGVLSTVDLYARYGNCAVVGNYNLPGTSNSGLYPFVSSTGNIVTLANYNEVAGLNMLNAGGDAITNTAAGSHNFLLRSLEISGNGGRGIGLTNASGVGIIRNINVGSTNHPNPMGFGNNAGGGILIDTAGPGLDLAMDNVRMNASSPGAQPFGVKLIADDAYLNVSMNNVFTNGNGTGIQLSETSQQLFANMNFVRANNNANAGIQVDGTGGSITLNMNNVAAMNNGSNNLQIGTQAAPIVTSTVGITGTDTNFSNSKGGSGVVFSQSGGFGTLNLFNSVATNNAVDGLGIFGSNSTLMNANIQNGQFQGNIRDAFHVEGVSAATINLFVDPTDASHSGRDGLYYKLNGDSLLNVAFLDDNLNNSGRSAVHGELTNFSIVNLFFDGTTGRNSGGDGFYLNASGGSFANMQVDHGTLANSGRLIGGSSAFNIVSDNSTINLLSNLTPANNIMPNDNVGNQAYGLKLDLKNASVFTGNIYNSDLSDALVDAIKINATTGSDASLTLINTIGNRSGFDGIVANVDYSTLVTNFTNSNFGNSGRDGMNFNVTNGGELFSQFNGSSFIGNGRAGIYGSVEGPTSVASINLMNASNVNNNAQHGIDFIVDAGELNVTSTSSSISRNGQGGISGSGVLGILNNNGAARLNFNNATINNNLDNGVFVTSRTGSIIQTTVNLGTVSNNGTSQITPNGNDGIRLDVDSSPFSFLKVINGATISGNGNDGVSILASHGTQFVGAFGTDVFGNPVGSGISILNNGTAPPLFTGTRAGVNITSQSDSQVDLTMDGARIGNSSQFGPQQIGLLFNANTTGRLNAFIESTNLSTNTADAINGTVTGPGSIANLSMVNVTGNNSGAAGALFNVLGGGLLNVDGSVNTSFSQNGGAGVLVQVDGANSQANFDFEGIALDGNGQFFGGQGFSGLATHGGNLNAVILTSSISNNANQGILITTADPNSVGNFHVAGTSINANGSEGLLIRVENEGEVNYRSIGNTYNNNGSNGFIDGVKVTAIGNGPSDSATARLLFNGDTVNFNSGNGFSLDAQNGATLTTSIQNGVSGSFNGGYGIFQNATGANTKFNLLMDGVNTFEGNTLGPISPLNFANIDQAVIVLTGSYNNSGVKATYTDVNNALFALVGPGTVNNSVSDGVNVQMTNVNNGSVLLNGVTSINNSNGDGVRITMDNVTSGAINLFGPTQIDQSAARGIDISLTNTSLVNNIPFGTTPIKVLTTTDNLPSPLNNQLPIPVLIDLNTAGIVANTALVVQGQTVTKSGAEGISLNLQTSTVETNGSFLLQNFVSESKGDGILITANNSSADGMLIRGTSSNLNTGNGLNIVGDNSSLKDMVINSGGAGVNTGLDFTIVGNTFPDTLNPGAFKLINTSTTAIENLTAFHLDTSTSISNAVFNTVAGASFPFTPANGTDVTAGLTTVNGTIVPPYPANLVADFSQVLDMTFDNFNPGKNFAWDIDLDTAPGAEGSIFGNDLIGSTILVTYTGGLTLGGNLVALPGDPTASHFVATTGNVGSSSYSSNGLDGVRFSLNNTDLSNLNMTNNQIQSNGTTGSGHGIEFTGTGGAVAGSTLTGVTLSNNTITLNSGDGVRLVNPQTTNSTIELDINKNTISQNTGNGVNLSLVAGQQDLRASFASNTITQNTTGAGINVQLANNRNYTGGFDSNIINQNGAQGINLNMGLNGQVTSNFTSNTINGNTGDGINIGLKTGGHFEGAQFYGNTIGTAASHNGGMGVRLTVPDQASFNWNLGDSTKAANLISGNTTAGVGIDMTGSANGNLRVQNSTFSNTIAGDGLAIHLNQTATLNNAVIGNFNAVNSIATNDTNFANNAGNGLLIETLGNSTMQNLLITNVNATGNTGSGVQISRIGNPILDNTIIQNSQFRTNGNGLNLIAGNALRVDEYSIHDNEFVQNTQDGIRIDVRFDAQIDAQITDNLIDRNRGNGINVIEQNNAPTDNRLVTGTWQGNTITNNLGSGIQISARHDLNIGASTTQIQNLITGNGQNGILINGVNALSNTVIQGNVIGQNGGNGIIVNGTLNDVTIDTNMIHNNGGDGIDLFGRNGARLIASVDNNSVRFNGGDGIKINSSGQVNTGQPFIVTIGTNNANGNDISDNLGHGINILNQNNGLADITIENNAINRNGLEGVYVVNTASASQAQNSTIGVVADGNVFDRAQMRFEMNNNSVLDNGHLAIGANFSDTTGLYLRVGTNGASQNVADPGQFASTASTVNSVAGASLTGRGGVLALISDNVFGGNAGHDVAFESFTSTVAPATGGAGNWTDQNETPPNPVNDIFNPVGYQTDPLARLDLQFVRNKGEDADVTRSGAAYQSTDPIWKSRIGTDPAVASPPGPFGDGGSRQRNAQRLASRAAPFSAPFSSLGAAFLYPGVGSSTFRVSSDSNFNNGGNPNTNIFASTDSFNSQVPLGVLFGELSFNWTTNLAP